jgi:hypothetical protein
MNRTDLSQIVVDTAKNFRACLAGIAATDTLAGGIVLETVTFLRSTGRSIPDGPKGYPITSGLVSLLFGYQAYYWKLPE